MCTQRIDNILWDLTSAKLTQFVLSQNVMSTAKPLGKFLGQK